MGKMFLLVINVYTKWLDVHVTSISTSTVTTELLRKLFSTYGLPEVVVSDNATNFTSDEFEAFLRANGVKHVCTPPHHPASNGLVERAVQTLNSQKWFKEVEGRINRDKSFTISICLLSDTSY